MYKYNYNMSNNSVDYIKNFFDSTANIIYFIILGLILIIIAYGTNIKKNNFISLIVRVGIVALYLYIFTIVFNSLVPIYNINGLFIDPGLDKVKSFFILYCLFQITLILLVIYIFYTFFK